MSHYIAGDYLCALLDHAGRVGVSPNELLDAQSMPSSLVGQLPLPVFNAAAQALAERTGRCDEGLRLGLSLGIANHGIVGYAIRSADTVLEALLIDQRFLSTRTSALQFRVSSEGEWISLHIDSSLLPRSFEDRFGRLMVLGTLARCYADITGSPLPRVRFFVPFDVTALRANDSPELAGVEWHEAPDVCRIEAPVSIGHTLLMTRDETLKALLVAQCESELDRSRLLVDPQVMVRNLLKNALIETPTLGDIARQMGMGERTLKRRLLEAGTSFREILIDVRVEAATQYLRSTTWTLEEIAYRLGYTSPVSFKVLFRRWTGKTPGQVRREKGSE